jgi:hypothetical protein
LADLLYYGIEDVDGSKVNCDLTSAAQLLSCMEVEIKSWRINISMANLAEYCAFQYMQFRQLLIDIKNPINSSPFDNTEIWKAITSIQEQGRKSDQGYEKCNHFLCKIGLEVISCENHHEGKSVIVKIVMRLAKL